ncbi:MAG: N-acetylmuramoyl-L-alanine amidase [Clostridia bacterium]|nr:N-acetylmuramoyl-L-alanine amidase [Clostridia bacterium]
MKRYALFLFFIKTLCISLALIALLLSLIDVFYRFDSKDTPSNASVNVADTQPTVILDAGHGGVDSGAVSIWGEEEKHINLAVTKKLGAFLEAGGARVIYTRSDDSLLTSDKTSSRKMGDLMGRVEIADRNPDAVFVSIHMNTLPIEKYNGLQVFYDDNNGTNRALALSIQNDVKNYLQKDNHREVKNADGKIYILDRIENPSVLVECGFLSNREEAQLLCDDEYQAKLAFVLSRSILSLALAEKYEEI